VVTGATWSGGAGRLDVEGAVNDVVITNLGEKVTDEVEDALLLSTWTVCVLASVIVAAS
jgi:hypothetical protein